MPTVNCSPFGPKPQFEIAAGTPAVGYQLFFYVAGTSGTKQNTYTTSSGSVANTNPLILNSLGQPTTEIWFTAGQSYKVVLAPSTDTDPPTSPVWTVDNLRGINDTTVTIDQWVSGPTPTFINATQFSLVGDQTSIFQVGRRIKAVVTAGTVYGRITVSAFAAVTTVTVVLDSGALDSGMSAVSYGLISSLQSSIGTAGFAYTGYSSGQVPTLDANGKLAFSALDPDYQQINVSQAGGALTFSVVAGEYLEFRVNNVRQQVLLTAAITLTLPSGGTLGTPTTENSRVWVAAMYNSGTPELAIINTWDGSNVYEIRPTDSISTTAVGAGSTAAQTWYSTTGRATQPIAILGYIEAVNTAGAWATPSLAVGYGPGIPLPGEIIQTRRTTTGTVSAPVAVATPNDNTIPQVTEGNSYITRAITPTSALNILEFNAIWNGTNTGAVLVQIVHLHQTGVNDAIAVSSQANAGASQPMSISVGGQKVAGSAGSLTFDLRSGNATGTAATFNGSAGAQLMGGAFGSFLQVREFQR